MLEVTLYTRPNCSLCEKAKEAIRASGVETRILEVNIDEDPELRKTYAHDIPVIFVDGKEVCRHRVDPQAFARLFGAGPSIRTFAAGGRETSTGGGESAK